MKLTPAEIVAAIEAEEALCMDASRGELQAERADALDRYRGMPYGNEQEGRSAVVDRSIADTVEWVMPSLIRVFMGGDEIGKFAAYGPEDEEAAQTETEVCNWYVQNRNDYFSQISAVIRDALLLKNGYMAVIWDVKEDTKTETYVGKSDEEVAMLEQDAEVEIVEHTAYPDPEWQAPPPEMIQQVMMQAQQAGQPPPPMPSAPLLHDVKIERKRADEYPAMEAIPPDELLVSKRHRWTSLVDCDFVQWRRKVSIGQLREEGFDVPDDAPNDDDTTQEQSRRDRYGDLINADDESGDPSRRMVIAKHTWMRIDLRGAGTPQLWRIDLINGADEPMRTEEADVVPIAGFAPIVYPHSHIGTSVYDLICDLALIKTVLMRQYLDGVYLANSGRTAVDVGRVNLDDLLVSRPGGVIRGEGNPNEWMMPVVSADVTGSVLQGLQYIDSTKEQRTGVRAWTEGMGSASLHPTATGVQSVDSAAAQRIELIARTLASGFRDLFVIIHAMVSKHATKPIQIKLKNEWKAIDPRSWTRRTDFSISVGLGVGTPDAQLMKLQALAPMLGQAMNMGLAGPQEAYNYGAEVLKAAGYRNPDRFMHAPQKDAQGKPVLPPPPKDPLVQTAEIKAQADAQSKQAEMANDAQRFQAEQAGKREEMQMQDAMKQRELAANLELQRSNDERQAQLDIQKHALEQQTKIQIAQLQSATSIEVARISRGDDENLKVAQEQMGEVGATAEVVSGLSAQLVQTLTAALEQMQAVLGGHAAAVTQAANMSKRIVRDPLTGKAIGVEPVRTVQ